ncbi:hypothetical protein L914_12197 [Phytophthora nicotianae]|uniref:Uncharacterized protein n=1 Tax=Phytophthora nicotianae TaxID=4792 RepID=W2N304_PHYNI|nr:hypothetical protein L914_12197 [Phytophthora nicotianae]
MPTEPGRRGRTCPHLLAEKCQYLGECSQARTVKTKDDLRRFCNSHRDHQNALQQKQYR